MDRFVADPHWHDYILWYFYLGGIAAGAYAQAMLAVLFGSESDRRSARGASYLALPIVALCGLLLTIDLGRPERFWHMLIQSETFRPMVKWWSPMSAGSWGLTTFGGFSAVSFLAVLIEDQWLPARFRARWVVALNRSKVFALGGLVSAFFLGSYTGALLSATNQPVWANTTWLAPLFLASSASTGIAALLLFDRWRGDGDEPARERLEWADHWAIGLEAVLLAAFAVSLGGLAVPALGRWPGVLIPAVVVPLGLVAPPVVARWGGRGGAWAAPVSVLIAGFALRAAVVGMPPPLLLTHH